jgi:hypothetical protein
VGGFWEEEVVVCFLAVREERREEEGEACFIVGAFWFLAGPA